jgi:replicative DNA helicase
MTDVLPPHDIDAERGVLGSVLLDQAALFDVLPFLRADDFWLIRHGWIYETFEDLHKRGQPIDFLTVSQALRQAGRLDEVGGEIYLIQLSDITIHSYNCEAYGRIVERMAVRRRLIEAAGVQARAAHDDSLDIEEVIAKSEDAQREVIDRHVLSTSPDRNAEDVAVECQIEACQWRDDPRDVRGLATGLYPFDMATGGLEPGLFYQFCARPGVGKSAVIAMLTREFARQGIAVALMSLEMTDKAMIRRMAVQASRVDATLLKCGRLPKDDFDRYMAALDDLARAKDRIRIVSRAGLSIIDMQAKVRQFERDCKIGLVIIDTLNRVRSDGKSPYERMTLNSHACADWAHNADYPLWVALQLSRANEKSSNTRPSLDALRDSGALEEDADWIGGLHREYAHARSEEERQKVIAEGKEHLAELIVLKNRDGESERAAEMYWDAKSLIFMRLDRKHVDMEPNIQRPPKSYVLGRDDPGYAEEAAR